MLSRKSSFLLPTILAGSIFVATIVVLYQNKPIEKTRPALEPELTFSSFASPGAVTVMELLCVGQALLGLLLLPVLDVGVRAGRRVRGYLSRLTGRLPMRSIGLIRAVLLLK